MLGLIVIIACGGGGGGVTPEDPVRERRYLALNALYTPSQPVTFRVGSPLTTVATDWAAIDRPSGLTGRISGTSVMDTQVVTPAGTFNERTVQSSNDRQMLTVFGPPNSPNVVIMPYMNQGEGNARLTFAQLDSNFPNVVPGGQPRNWDIHLLPAGTTNPSASTVVMPQVGYNLDLPINMVKWKNQVAPGTYTLVGMEGTVERFRRSITLQATRETFVISTRDGNQNVIRVIDGGRYF